MKSSMILENIYCGPLAKVLTLGNGETRTIIRFYAQRKDKNAPSHAFDLTFKIHPSVLYHHLRQNLHIERAEIQVTSRLEKVPYLKKDGSYGEKDEPKYFHTVQKFVNSSPLPDMKFLKFWDTKKGSYVEYRSAAYKVQHEPVAAE